MMMIRPRSWFPLALLALAGCGVETGPTTQTPITPVATSPTAKEEVKSVPVDPAKADDKKGAAAAAPKLTDEEIAQVKKLPADEQPIALAQVTCPVSGENLGSMDKPLKETIGDKTFFICCASCEKTVKNKPDEVLAKLKK